MDVRSSLKKWKFWEIWVTMLCVSMTNVFVSSFYKVQRGEECELVLRTDHHQGRHLPLAGGVHLLGVQRGLSAVLGLAGERERSDVTDRTTRSGIRRRCR